MAENPVPKSIPELLTFAEIVYTGLGAIGSAIYVKQNTPEVLLDALERFRAANGVYDTAVAFKATKTAASTTADADVKNFLGHYTDVLKPRLGRQWNAGWKDTGFANNTLAVPVTTGGRQEAIRVAGEYLTAHADMESAVLGVTAAHAKALHVALDNARTAVRDALSDTTQKRLERDSAMEALRAQLRGTIAELTQLLAPDDARWSRFGLNAPAAPNRPDVPDGLLARPGPAGSGTLYLDWDDAPRAERYRVYKQITGVDSDFVAAVTVHDSAVTLAELPAGAEIKIRVTAANDTGETSPSDEVKVTLA
jgi:hypothetical protein